MPFMSIARVIKETFRSTRQRIGGGGNGDVYLQRGPLGRKTAVKEPHGDHPDGRWRIMGEAFVLRDLMSPGHPGIQRFRGLGNDYLKTDYFEGIHLKAYILKYFADGMREKALPVFRKILSAVAYIHDQGFVHADLKLENILFNGSEILVIDYDIARPDGQRLEIETNGGEEPRVIGTPNYLSPNRLFGRAPSKEDDIHALGLILFEMWTGTKAINITKIMKEKGISELEAYNLALIELKDEVRLLPEPIQDLILCMIDSGSGPKYKNCHEFIAFIDAWIGEPEQT
jgi:serine/threonine protein kinase